MPGAAHARDRDVAAEQQARRGLAERDDHLRAHRLDLAVEERPAGATPRPRAACGSRAADTSRCCRCRRSRAGCRGPLSIIAREQLAGAAHERAARAGPPRRPGPRRRTSARRRGLPSPNTICVRPLAEPAARALAERRADLSSVGCSPQAERVAEKVRLRRGRATGRGPDARAPGRRGRPPPARRAARLALDRARRPPRRAPASQPRAAASHAPQLAAQRARPRLRSVRGRVVHGERARQQRVRRIGPARAPIFRRRAAACPVPASIVPCRVRVDLRLHLELEARVVGVVVAASRRSGGSRRSRTCRRARGSCRASAALSRDVVAARAVARLAADAREIRVLGAALPPVGKPPALAEARRVAARQARRPACFAFASVASARGVRARAQVAYSAAWQLWQASEPTWLRRGRQQVERGAPRSASSARRSAAGSARMCAFAAWETRGRKVAYSKPSECFGSWQVEAGALVVAARHEVRREVRAAAAVAGLAADVLELAAGAWRGRSRRACRSRPRGSRRTRRSDRRRGARACRRRRACAVRCQVSCCASWQTAQASLPLKPVACAAASAPARRRAAPAACAAAARRARRRKPWLRAAMRPSRVDQHDVRNAAEDAVGVLDLVARRRRGPGRSRARPSSACSRTASAAPGQLDADERRPLVLGELRELPSSGTSRSRGSAGRCAGRRAGPRASRAARPGRSAPSSRARRPRRSARAGAPLGVVRPARAGAARCAAAPRRRSRRVAVGREAGHRRRSRSPRRRRRAAPAASAGRTARDAARRVVDHREVEPCCATKLRAPSAGSSRPRRRRSRSSARRAASPTRDQRLRHRLRRGDLGVEEEDEQRACRAASRSRGAGRRASSRRRRAAVAPCARARLGCWRASPRPAPRSRTAPARALDRSSAPQPKAIASERARRASSAAAPRGPRRRGAARHGAQDSVAATAARPPSRGCGSRRRCRGRSRASGRSARPATWRSPASPRRCVATS